MNEKQRESLAELVRRLRSEKNLSLTDVERNAKRAGYEIAGSYVNRIENEVADSEGLTVKKLQALAAGLEYSEDKLFAVARGKSPDDPSVEHAEIAAMYDDIPPLCRQDVRDLLGVLQRNHSISARRRQRPGRRAAAAAGGTLLREARQMEGHEQRRPVEVEPDEGEDVPQANSPEVDDAQQDVEKGGEEQPVRRRANGN